MPEPQPRVLSAAEVSALIPHERPFRFIDGATILEPGRSAKAYMSRLTDPDYDWLRSHFSWKQIVPGAILAEATAELLGVAVASGHQDQQGLMGVYSGIEPLKFRRMVLPTDLVLLEAELIGNIKHVREAYFGSGNVRVTVAKNLAAKGVISFALVDRERFEAGLTPVAANKDQAQAIIDKEVIVRLIFQEEIGLYRQVAEQTGFKVAVAAEEGEYFLEEKPVNAQEALKSPTFEEYMQALIVEPVMPRFPAWIGQVAVSIQKPPSELTHTRFLDALKPGGK
jgi:3-hydroxyacyl-[acyl-carrier-protein] dehydratase